ncbi:hypothetical protein P7K49_017626 [Saguinus oedipus]|uniref:Uncharacterized protein n=1 Tax=Saguinus oedipus TaxID=9490 RepID=A0ABQ9V409_SAGOE|nr:hypothetical protein P7K49_017626 [Saguinus oedipus]
MFLLPKLRDPDSGIHTRLALHRLHFRSTSQPEKFVCESSRALEEPLTPGLLQPATPKPRKVPLDGPSPDQQTALTRGSEPYQQQAPATHLRWVHPATALAVAATPINLKLTAHFATAAQAAAYRGVVRLARLTPGLKAGLTTPTPDPRTPEEERAGRVGSEVPTLPGGALRSPHLGL